MDSLYVYIEINGLMTRVGSLTGSSYRDTVFTYDLKYMESEIARPISISLPLEEVTFSPERTKAYFESLLPEGYSRRAVADWAHVNEDDYISLLECLGKECIGAIQIIKDDVQLGSEYIMMTKEDMLELAREGATKSTEILIESHISLAGASGKVGLYYDEENDEWYKPYGLAASTHIVKQSHVRLEQLVVNEQLCMRTASKLDIDVPKSFIIKPGNSKEEELLYATERYDRVRRGSGRDLISPYRLHQEDFAQALGVASSEKYEIEDRQYLKRMFELINNYSANPIEDGIKLWDRVIYNFLIGNTDAHIKNYGLLYSTNLDSIRLAPAYDMVCTRIYGNRNEMSVMINGKIDCTKVTREDFKLVTREVGIGQKIAMNHYDSIANNLEKALKESAYELKQEGIKEAAKLGEKILGVSGVKL